MGKHRHPLIVGLYHLIPTGIPLMLVTQRCKKLIGLIVVPIRPFLEIILFKGRMLVPLKTQRPHLRIRRQGLRPRIEKGPDQLSGIRLHRHIPPGVILIHKIHLLHIHLQDLTCRPRRIDGPLRRGHINAIQPMYR